MRDRLWHRSGWRPALVFALAALLAACGGGGGDAGGSGSASGNSCAAAEQKSWLASYFNQSYFWSALAPAAPSVNDGSQGLGSFFAALLYRGGTAPFPADRWSNIVASRSFNQFFTDGQSLGYGVSLAALEVAGQPEQPLRVRHVEPLSPAAAAGVQRGDQVISINGRSAASLIAGNDFSPLSATAEGETLSLVLQRDGVQRSASVVARLYNLSPVGPTAVLSTPQGRKLGYVMVKDMINQARAPLQAAFADFKAQGVQDLVLDLRYNGGGLVSVGGELASYAAAAAAGEVYARLLFNDKQQASNSSSRFSALAGALDLPRVYVLAGRRTCSASEQVINGLRPMAQVVVIGEATCGKPVGFQPVDRCDNTYSVVNFESVNARGEGRYFDGLAATCNVADDLGHPLGDAAEGLLAAARAHADSGSCPAVAQRESPQRRAGSAALALEPGEGRGMLAR